MGPPQRLPLIQEMNVDSLSIRISGDLNPFVLILEVGDVH